MGKKRYFIGFSLVIAALLLLVVTNFRKSMQYYFTVDEVFAATEDMLDAEFKLSGQVVAGSIVKANLAEPVYEFDVTNKGKVIHVVYKGLAPDTFNDESTVVVTGILDRQAMTFEAKHLLAKCASKYEAKLQ